MNCLNRVDALMALSVDVEYGRGDVSADTEWLLALFEEFGVRGTFFILGDVARALPHLVETIARAGHEIGFHGEQHRFLSDSNPETLARELGYWKPRLEDLAQRPVQGYRAPFFSINQQTSWALPVLQAAGIRYDASIYPGWHDRYGWRCGPRVPCLLEGSTLALFPVPLLHPWLPVGFSGGGYLRILPWHLILWGLRRQSRQRRDGMIYVHPWEVSPVSPAFSEPAILWRVPGWLGWQRMRWRLRTLIQAEHRRCRTMENILALRTPLPIWNSLTGVARVSSHGL